MKSMLASTIAAHPDDAQNYPIDMCWSRKGFKGRRAMRGHHALSRLFDRRQASFDRVHADKNEQRACESGHANAARAFMGWDVYDSMLTYY